MSVQTEKAVPVRAHRFGTGPEYTLGIEEELMLVDADGLALAPRVEQVVTAIGDGRVKRELMQCQIELATSPQRTVAAAEEELRELRSRVVRIGAQLGRAPRRCRHAPVLALRVPAVHGVRPLPRAVRRPALPAAP